MTIAKCMLCSVQHRDEERAGEGRVRQWWQVLVDVARKLVGLAVQICIISSKLGNVCPLP